MTIQLGQIAPDSSAETTIGPIRFHRAVGASFWTAFFSHPKDSIRR